MTTLQRILKKIVYLSSLSLEYVRDTNVRKYYKNKTKIYNQLGEKSKIVLFLTPEYGNLGDHLLALSSEQYFLENHSEKLFIEVTMQHYLHDKIGVHRLVQSQDVVAIAGGGFLGDVWPNNDRLVRDVIKAFHNNKVVILPQTISINDNDSGEAYLDRLKAEYRAHRNLYVIFRELQSKEFAIKNNILPKERCQVAPDLALRYYRVSDNVPRTDRVFVCFRKDKEKVVSESVVRLVDRLILQSGLEKVEISTEVEGCVLRHELRKTVLNAFMNNMSKCRILITDRLHGMIFAALTGTPCIAFDNSTHKVSGVYHWIKELPYIVLIDDTSNLKEVFDNLIKSNKNYIYPRMEILKKFSSLDKFINEK